MPGRGYGVKKKTGTRRTAGPSPRKKSDPTDATGHAPMERKKPPVVATRGSKGSGGRRVTGGPTPRRTKPKPKTPAPKRKTARRTMR